MKIYLAARYGRRDQLRELRSFLQAMGHVVTSSWLDSEWKSVGSDAPSHAPPGEREKACNQNLVDLDNADCCISFTEDPASADGKRGGRHVEFGYALAKGKRVIVVGYTENVFHFHKSVEFFRNREELLQAFTVDLVISPNEARTKFGYEPWPHGGDDPMKGGDER